jgi:hypothetical protein
MKTLARAISGSAGVPTGHFMPGSAGLQAGHFILLVALLALCFVLACAPQQSSGDDDQSPSSADDDDDSAPVDDDNDDNDDSSLDDDDDASPSDDDDDDNDDDNDDNDDDNLAWTAVYSDAAAFMYGVWAVAPDDVFVVGGTSQTGSAWHYDGAAWSLLTIPSNVFAMNGVWASSPTNVYALDGFQIVHFDGQIWSAVYTGQGGAYTTEWLLGVWGASASDIFVVGYYDTALFISGEMLHGGGTNWASTLTGSGDDNILYGVGGSSGSDVFAVGGNVFPGSGPCVVHFDGASWTASTAAGGGVMASVWSASPTDAFAAGCGGAGCSATFPLPLGGSSAVWRYDGAKWTPMTVPAGPMLTSVWGSSSSDVFAVGWRVNGDNTTTAGALHFDGASWQTMGFPSSVAWISGVSGTSPTDVYAVGGTDTAGVVLHYGPNAMNNE